MWPISIFKWYFLDIVFLNCPFSIIITGSNVYDTIEIGSSENEIFNKSQILKSRFSPTKVK